MKQMRSRFRLISLLLACAFLLTAAVCTGTVLKTAGITLQSLIALPASLVSVSPDPSASNGFSPDPETTPAPSGLPAAEIETPGTDNTPEPEYNVFGL